MFSWSISDTDVNDMIHKLYIDQYLPIPKMSSDSWKMHDLVKTR